jgi:hypothetical protein
MNIKRSASMLALLLTIFPVKMIAQEPSPTPSSESQAERAAEPKSDEQKSNKQWSLAFSGEFNNYFISESHALFGSERRSWLETSASLTGRFSYKKIAIEVSGLGIKTTGQDPFGTGSAPPDAQTGPGTFPVFRLEKAYIQISNIGGSSLKATFGRQPITIGSQFLVGDGVYDGYAPNARQAVYHNPRRSFDAVRVEWDFKRVHFDSFLFRVDPTWDAAGGHDGLFGGLDVSRTFEKNKATYAAGLFYRHSPSKADNNMAVLNLRGEQHLPMLKDFYASGELVFEFAGKCRNGFYCTSPGQRMNERAAHLEVGYEASRTALRPFAEAGYVYYSKDFTPVATGFSDWGKWYLGNQIDWLIFGSNTKVIRGQVGFWPYKTVKLRAQYHNTRQARPTGSSTGGSLANEWTYIAEWFPKDKLWFNLAIGDSRPGKALAPSGLGNPFQWLNSGAVPTGTSNSVGVVLATGWRF